MKYLLMAISFFFLLSANNLWSQKKDSLKTNRNVVKADSTYQKTISGTVTDDAGQPFPGVSVLIKGTYKGTSTDFDGRYSIQADRGDLLVFSFIGYNSYEVIVGMESTINIILVEDSSALEEVVLVAYKSEEEEYFTIPCLNAKRLIGQKKYDSRFEKAQLDSLVDWQSSILKKTKSVAVIIEKEKIFAISNEEYQLDTSNTLGKVYNLCSNQIFTNQPVIGTGTGFVIGPKSMITAKHVFEGPIENYLVVFGFEVADKFGTVHSKILVSDIYYPKKIEKQFEELDIVMFTVDREFNRPVLEWENSRNIKEKTEIYMIGHPSGLPIKVALNAGVVDNSKFQYFYTSLDGFQGNSGSPIFNLCTNKVIGVLVSGELDYEYNGNCYETTLCKIPFCKGEKVIRIENIMNN